MLQLITIPQKTTTSFYTEAKHCYNTIYSGTYHDFTNCVHHVIIHVAETTGYHNILTILIQKFYICSEKYLFGCLNCGQIQRKSLCFHSGLINKYKT